MPYIDLAKRYDVPQPASVMHNFADMRKTMGRYEGTFTPAPVIRKRPADEPLEPTRNKHPLPQRPPPTALPKHGFRRRGSSGAVGGDQAGHGGQYGSQQYYGQHGYQRRQTEAEDKQDSTHHHAYQLYPSILGQGSGAFWQQRGNQNQRIPTTSPEAQAWQAEYFRQYQQYALSLQYSLFQQLVQKAQPHQHTLTQQWQTADKTGTLSAAQLNANAASFTPQVEPVMSVSALNNKSGLGVDKEFSHARRNPHRIYPNFNPSNGGVTSQQPTAPLPNWTAATTPWYGPTGQRTGPSSNTRSFTSGSKSPEAEAKIPRLHFLKRPKPTAEYIKQASETPGTLSAPRPLLIVLDLNGTLLYRTVRGGSSFKARPHVKQFLQYLLKNHFVMVWSSARPYNVQKMCQKLLQQSEMDQLVVVWSRDDLRLSKRAYSEKVQVYKQLSWAWENESIQSKHPSRQNQQAKPTAWSQADTVLIDDSIEKGASEPYNFLELEEFEAKHEQMKVDVLGQVVKYLETLSRQRDVSAFMRSKPFAFDAEVAFDWSPFLDNQ